MKVGTITAAVLEDLSSLFDLSVGVEEISNQLMEQIQNLNHSIETAPEGTPEVNKAYAAGMSDAYQRVVASIHALMSTYGGEQTSNESQTPQQPQEQEVSQ
jgi:hypothetical protein